MTTNHTVLDLNKVAYANLSWFTHGQASVQRLKPRTPTVNGTRVDPQDFCPAVVGKDGKEIYPRELAIERAKRRGLVDVWRPQVTLQLCNSHSVVYTGKKAQRIYREFSRRQFSKPKG